MTAAALAGGDWYRSTGLRDASELCHAAEGHNTGIPKAITANDVQRLLDGCDISDPAGVRDYANLLLEPRVRLRSIEAAWLHFG